MRTAIAEGGAERSTAGRIHSDTVSGGVESGATALSGRHPDRAVVIGSGVPAVSQLSADNVAVGRDLIVEAQVRPGSNEGIQVAVGMDGAADGKIWTAKEGEIAFGESSELKDGNQRDLRVPDHAYFLSAGQSGGGQHIHGDDLCPEALVRAGSDGSPICDHGGGAGRAQLPGGYLIVRPSHRRQAGLHGSVAQGADLRGSGREGVLEGRSQVGGHFLDSALGAGKGGVILQIGAADFAFGIHHQHEADRETRKQQEHHQRCDQRESPVASLAFHPVSLHNTPQYSAKRRVQLREASRLRANRIAVVVSQIAGTDRGDQIQSLETTLSAFQGAVHGHVRNIDFGDLVGGQSGGSAGATVGGGTGVAAGDCYRICAVIKEVVVELHVNHVFRDRHGSVSTDLTHEPGRIESVVDVVSDHEDSRWIGSGIVDCRGVQALAGNGLIHLQDVVIGEGHAIGVCAGSGGRTGDFDYDGIAAQRNVNQIADRKADHGIIDRLRGGDAVRQTARGREGCGGCGWPELHYSQGGYRRGVTIQIKVGVGIGHRDGVGGVAGVDRRSLLEAGKQSIEIGGGTLQRVEAGRGVGSSQVTGRLVAAIARSGSARQGNRSIVPQASASHTQVAQHHV